jgi:diacylglycerol kinase (ATP)
MVHASILRERASEATTGELDMKDRIDPDERMEKARPDMGLGRLGKALGYSLAGLASAWRHEAAFRQEALAALILIPVACFLPVTLLQRALLIASVLMVMVVELLNSSIEAAIDRISLERHELSRRAKDTGSAAVLLALVVALVVWAAIVGGWLYGA